MVISSLGVGKLIEKERLPEIDIVKGVSILLVVLFHAGLTEGLIADLLKDIRMPLFFMISGYLYSSSKYQENFFLLAKDKFQTLLIPYLSFALIGCAIWVAIHLVNAKEINWIKPIQGIFYGNGNWIVANPPIWFLGALFFSFLIYNIIIKITQEYSVYAQLGIFCLVGFLGYIISIFIWLPFSIDIAMVSAMFLYVGHALKNNEILLKKKVFIYLVGISIPLFLMNFLLNIPLDMNQRAYGNLIAMYSGGVTGSLLVIFLAKFVLAKVKFLKNILTALGKESIIILGFHVNIGFYTVELLDALFDLNIRQNILGTTIIAIAITLIISIIVKKIPLLSLLLKGKQFQSSSSKLVSNQNLS